MANGGGEDIVQKVIIEADTEQLDKIGESADKNAESLEKLGEGGGRSLEELEKGARQAGVSMEDFARLSQHTQEQYIEYANRSVEATHKLGDAIKELPAGTEGAAGGLGEVGKGLDDVSEKSGVSGRELRALGKIAREFGLGDMAQAGISIARVATSLGTLGAAALAVGLTANALIKWADAAKQTADAAEKLSKVTADTPAALEKMAAGFESAGGKLKDFVKYVEETTIKMEALNKLKGLSDEAQKSLIDGANNVEKLAKEIEKALTSTERWPRSLNDLGKTFKVNFDELTKGETILKALDQAIINSGKAMDNGKFSIEKYNDEIRKFYNGLNETQKLLLRMAWEKAGIPKEVIESYTRTAEEHDKFQKKIADKQWQRDAFKDLDESLQKVKARFSEVGNFWTTLGISALRFWGRYAEIVLNALLHPIDTMEKVAKTLIGWAETAARGMGAAFGRVGEYIGEAWSKLVELFKEYIVEPLKNAWNAVLEFFKEKAGAIKTMIGEAWSDLKQLAHDYIVQPIIDAWDAVIKWVQGKADTIAQYVKDSWKDLKQWFKEHITDPLQKAWDDAVAYISEKAKPVTDVLDAIERAAKRAWAAIKGMFSAGEGGGAGVGAAAGGLVMASGGEVHGPGTSTSDSILARLSRGEFVIRAAAVDHWGPAIFHSLNALRMPQFAVGGLVPAIPRMATGGASPSLTGQRVLTLNIEGRSFQGLQIPERTAQSLERFAVHSQIASAGRKQSWRR